MHIANISAHCTIYMHIVQYICTLYYINMHIAHMYSIFSFKAYIHFVQYSNYAQYTAYMHYAYFTFHISQHKCT